MEHQAPRDKKVENERYRGRHRRDKDRRRGGTPEGKILNEVRYPTQTVPPNRLIETVARAITEVKDGFEVGGVCVAVPGLILASENKVIFAPNLHEIENIRLDEEIGCRTGLRITVENDASVAAWGEFRFGAGKASSTWFS